MSILKITDTITVEIEEPLVTQILQGEPGRSTLIDGGEISLEQGSKFVDYQFSSEIDIPYLLTFHFKNESDDSLSFYSGIVTVQAVSCFRIEFSDEIDSGNYVLVWTATEKP